MEQLPITLTLTQDEALVLFDWVVRYVESGTLAIEDQAEQRALWNLCATLETQVDVVLAPDYREQVVAARDRLRDELG
jgi:hypothetical protein